jgi:hypothetical protein
MPLHPSPPPSLLHLSAPHSPHENIYLHCTDHTHITGDMHRVATGIPHPKFAKPMPLVYVVCCCRVSVVAVDGQTVGKMYETQLRSPQRMHEA